jgi:hypothetical protein
MPVAHRMHPPRGLFSSEYRAEVWSNAVARPRSRGVHVYLNRPYNAYLEQRFGPPSSVTVKGDLLPPLLSGAGAAGVPLLSTKHPSHSSQVTALLLTQQRGVEGTQRSDCLTPLMNHEVQRRDKGLLLRKVCSGLKYRSPEGSHCQLAEKRRKTFAETRTLPK